MSFISSTRGNFAQITICALHKHSLRVTRQYGRASDHVNILTNRIFCDTFPFEHIRHISICTPIIIPPSSRSCFVTGALLDHTRTIRNRARRGNESISRSATPCRCEKRGRRNRQINLRGYWSSLMGNGKMYFHFTRSRLMFNFRYWILT